MFRSLASLLSGKLLTENKTRTSCWVEQQQEEKNNDDNKLLISFRDDTVLVPKDSYCGLYPLKILFLFMLDPSQYVVTTQVDNMEQI